MVSLNKALLGPYFLGGGSFGGAPLDCHDILKKKSNKTNSQDGNFWSSPFVTHEKTKLAPRTPFCFLFFLNLGRELVVESCFLGVTLNIQKDTGDQKRGLESPEFVVFTLNKKFCFPDLGSKEPVGYSMTQEIWVDVESKLEFMSLASSNF